MSQKFVETQEVKNYVIILEISDVPLEKNLPHCAAAPFSLMSGGRQPPWQTRSILRMKEHI